MSPPGPSHFLLRWTATLKFKIVAGCVFAAASATAVTTHFLLRTTQADTLRLVLRQDAQDRERTARLLASKVHMLQVVLNSTAGMVTPEVLEDAAAATRLMTHRTAMNALFDATFVARADDGRLLARLERGVPGTELPNQSPNAYFHDVVSTGLPVVSRPTRGRVSQKPIVIFAVPVKSAAGRVIGVVGGSVVLASTGLLSPLDQEAALDGSHHLVFDDQGTILSHARPERLLGKAKDEAGLGRVFAAWADAGATIHAEGVASLSDGYLVSIAGVPNAGWMLARLTSEAEALQPLQAGRRAAWQLAAGVGCVVALLSGALAWLTARPITRLRQRAERLHADAAATAEPWPRSGGEIGALSRAFQHVIEQAQRRQIETQDMLRRLEAVLHNAEVGVAFTRSGRFELVSRRFGEIFGFAEGQAVGQPTRVIYASDAAFEALAARARPSFMASSAFDGEVELMRRNGEVFWAHMRGRALEPGNLGAGTIWLIEDVTQERAQREQLTWAARHDALTGLLNRAAFEVLIEQATARSTQRPFCALFIDLDRFKLVNDTAGHPAGDALLRGVAQQLATHVRQSDTVARLGGDEFAVLLDGCPNAQALVIAEQLRVAVESHALEWEGGRYGVGASIGLVHVDGRFASVADVMRAADSACYAAKRTGRNRVSQHEAAANEDAVPAANWAI